MKEVYTYLSRVEEEKKGLIERTLEATQAHNEQLKSANASLAERHERTEQEHKNHIVSGYV